MSELKPSYQLTGNITLRCPGCSSLHSRSIEGWEEFSCLCLTVIQHPLTVKKLGRPYWGQVSIRKTISIPKEMSQSLDRAASHHGTTPSSLIRVAISSLLSIPE